MVEDVMVFQYDSVSSWCLQRCCIHACNSECVVRRLTEVHCVLCIVYVPEILILGYCLLVRCINHGICCLYVYILRFHRILLLDILFWVLRFVEIYFCSLRLCLCLCVWICWWFSLFLDYSRWNSHDFFLSLSSFR